MAIVPTRAPAMTALLRLALPVVAALLAACTTPGTGDEQFRPLLGQAGKDVMWVPTTDALVMPMLELAQVTREDLVVDLGSGDGKIPIAAAQRFGARAVGIEYDARLSALAQRNAERAGVTDRVRMIHGDIFKEDFSAATVLTLFLGRDLNVRLMPTVLAMRPGTRVVSNNFDMDVWEPDRVVQLPGQNPLFLWVVPARLEGRWEITGLPEAPTVTVRLAQRQQKLDGTLQAGSRTIGPVEGRLAGTGLVLRYTGEGGAVRRVDAQVEDDQWRGRLQAGGAPVVARRIP